jgi:hypothetical protein
MFNVGDRVQIVDGSECHGELATVWHVEVNGVILLELATGNVWPVSETEIQRVEHDTEGE